MLEALFSQLIDMEFQRKINALWEAKKREEAQIRHHYFEEMQDLVVVRAAEIRKIEGFWSTTIQNHAGFQKLLTSRDLEIVRVIEDVSVDEWQSDAHSETVKLTVELGNNPIVATTSLWVQVSLPVVTSSGLLFHSTYSLSWLEESSSSLANTSFFRLFECCSAPVDSQERNWEAEKVWEVVQWMKTDLWEDPLKYFELSK